MRSFHYIFWFLLLRLAAVKLESYQSEEENESFARHLDANYSTVELFHKWPWILQGLLVKDYPLHQFHLEVDYQTTSQQGKLFTIAAESPFKHKFFVLDATFSEGLLQLKLVDGNNNTLIEQAPTSTKRTNDGHLHSIELIIDAEESAITLNDNIHIIAGNLFKTEEQHDLDMKLYLGAFNDSTPSIIGCVKVLNFGDYAQGIKEIPEIISSYKTSPCANKSEAQEKVFDLESSSELTNYLQTQIKNDTEDVVEQEQRATTKEAGAKIISVTSSNNSVISLSSNSSSQVTKGPPTEVFCRPSEETQCENHKQCTRISNSANFTCICKHGYGGRFCQFSLFARTCEDAFLFHSEANSGVYQVDMDGSGPMPMTFVECRKQKLNGLQQILSIVGHNFPNQTLVRSSKDKAAKFFPVTYKLFSPLQIQELISRSEQCEQYVRYDCNSAPLNFDRNSTWFVTSALENHHIRQIGNVPNTCACKTLSEGCAQDSQYIDKSVNCNCDDPSAKTFDEGTLLNENSAVSSIYLRPNHAQGHANLTLGEVKCRGEKGHLEEKTVTLKAQSARLELQMSDADKHEPFTQLEFDFKTSQKDIESMVYGNSFQGDQSNLWYISLKMGHRLAFQIDIYDKMENNSTNNDFVLNPIDVSILSQTKLNDLKWHRVIIEVFRDEIRFSIDNSHQFKQIQMSIHSFTYLFNTKIFIGSLHQMSGFTGCVRNFRVNNKLLELKIPDTADVAAGCADNCGEHSCEQNSQCIHNFENDQISCECKNKHIHSGLRCEKNMNKNSDVSFQDSAVGYLKYLDEHLPGNPLNTGIVFSVKTDQKNALLVYAHDQFDNFVQIHLSDEYKIVLTLNNDTQIARCTVHANHGTQFNDMRWLQIVLEQTSDQITMSVEDEVCEISGPHLLSQQKIDAFTGDFEEVILPPQPAGPVVASTPYYFLFVGGLPSVQHTRIKRDRIAYYVTNLPGLLGCMRGFMVNRAAVDLRQEGIRPMDSDAVKTGCYNDCDTLVCHNGGHCTVHWQNYDPTNQEKTGCDCSKTSYYGSNCLKDTGLTFTGDSSIVFDMSEPKRFFLHESAHQSLKFAFASEAAEPVQDQHLTTIYFSDGREFHAILTKNGSLNVTINSSNGQIIGSAPEFNSRNYTDGYRHFFQATFSKKEPVFVSLDAEKKSLDNNIRLHLADSQLFFFGGEAVELEEEEDEEDESGEEDKDLNQENGAKQQFFSPDDLLIHKRRKRNSTRGLQELASLDSLNVTKDKTEDGSEIKQSEVVARYRGCMSNIEIDFQTNEAVRFRPLLYYTKPKDIYHKSVRNDPRGSEKLAQSSCPAFRVTGLLPSQQRIIQFPVWEAPLYSFVFEDDQPVSKNIVETDQLVPWCMWLVALLVLWLIFMILLCCICRVCCCKRKKKQRREINKNDLEKKPILSNDVNPPKKKVVIKEPPIRLVFRSQPNGTEPTENNTHFDFPSTTSDDHEPGNYHNYPKSQPLPLLKRQPSVDQSSVPSFSTIPSEKGKNSVSENSSLYFTAQEYFPELEEEEDLGDFEDVDSVLAKGFDEKLPDVLDENARSMAIDRSNPSRMSSFWCK